MLPFFFFCNLLKQIKLYVCMYVCIRFLLSISPSIVYANKNVTKWKITERAFSNVPLNGLENHGKSCLFQLWQSRGFSVS